MLLRRVKCPGIDRYTFFRDFEDSKKKKKLSYISVIFAEILLEHVMEVWRQPKVLDLVCCLHYRSE